MSLEIPKVGRCSFCTYLQMEAHWVPLWATSHAVSMMNARQRTRGCIIVVPRRHLERAGSLTATEATHLALLIQRSGQALRRAFGPAGIHYWWSVGVLATQSEPHFHVQVVPRYEGIPYHYAATATLPRAEAGTLRGMRTALTAAERLVPDGLQTLAFEAVDWGIRVHQRDGCRVWKPKAERTRGSLVVDLDRRHTDFSHLDKDDVVPFVSVLAKLCAMYETDSNCEGVSVQWAEGALAGQTYGRVHAEVIPRRNDDGFSWLPLRDLLETVDSHTPTRAQHTTAESLRIRLKGMLDEHG
ncbi:HIT domain-containing protein [Nonomuraea sp. SMC257]|uniref:HIT domain-containing protein n=1 Tax=Nonomuraea montanisoli TaxID=2741721 RepID=A0A7Y6I4V5_9ACTN|nr:HIT domain-containing protein [Nonomuraea montanisoli]NUW30534.1 HIT domain-containing protein [Nonomuraea montanisoli]